jgi:hypothetical protein
VKFYTKVTPNYQMAIKYTKPFSIQDPPKFTRFFCLKIYHLATLAQTELNSPFRIFEGQSLDSRTNIKLAARSQFYSGALKTKSTSNAMPFFAFY